MAYNRGKVDLSIQQGDTAFGSSKTGIAQFKDVSLMRYVCADTGVSSIVSDANRKLLQETGSTTSRLVVVPSPGTGPSTRTCPNSCSLQGRLNGQPVTVFSNAQEFCRITKRADNSCVVTTLLKGQSNAVTEGLAMTGCIELSCR